MSYLSRVRKQWWWRHFTLFSTGFIQVFLVSMNTVYVASFDVKLAFLSSLGISYFWTHNVARTATGLERDRWVYSGGAAFGCIAGMTFARTVLGVL